MDVGTRSMSVHMLSMPVWYLFVHLCPGAELSCVLPLEDFPVGNYSLSVVVDGLASGPPVDRCTNVSCNGSSPVRVGVVAGLLHDQCVKVCIWRCL